MSKKYSDLLDFLSVVNKIKEIKREITNPDGTKEDDAQHMYMMCLLLIVDSDFIPDGVDKLHTHKLALVHDLPEIFAGDTWYLSQDKEGKCKREYDAAVELFKDYPELLELWLEYEARETKEAVCAKEVDVVQAVLSLLLNDGADWKRNKITIEREIDFSRHISTGSSHLGSFLRYLLKVAEERNLFYKEEDVS